MKRAAQDLRGHWALVTGASSGLGREFALQLAAMGMHLVVAARRVERLEQLAAEVRERYGCEVLTVGVDLATEAGVQDLVAAVASHRVEPLVLVNNAGAGYHGDFLALDSNRERAMIELDVIALAALTRVYAGQMVARGCGYILQVASIAAYQGVPGYALYAAAKAFVRNYGEAVRGELRGTGVSVTVLSPGVTATEFQEVAGEGQSFFPRVTMMPGDRVVRCGLQAMLRRRMSVVPGILNRISVGLATNLPRKLTIRLAQLLAQ